jgi:hypothetical protein
VTVSHALIFYRHELVTAITTIFFESSQVDRWKTCPSTCGFRTALLHHVTVLKCANGCPKIILDAKPQFPGLYAYLT